MPQNFTQVRIKGLQTFVSDFSQNNADYLQLCNNIIVNRDNIAEPRRGLKIYGTEMGGSPTTDVAKQLMTYKSRILRHFGMNSGTTIDYDDGSGNFTSFDGTYSEVSEGLRIKSAEANGNLYFTTDKGIKKISAATADEFNPDPGFITQAGGIPALDLNGNIDYSSTGFFTQNSVVAYRIVWGITDANTNLILGVPSQRFVIYNPLMPLLTKDLNNLLNSIDAAAAVNTGTLQNTDYYTNFNVALTASATTVYNSLLGLCTELDSDIGGTTYTTIATAQTPPSVNPTSTELLALQAFYDAIVSALLAESLANIDATAQAAGNFQLSTQSSVVDLQFPIPQEITTSSYFYQVYRTAVTTATGPVILTSIDPGDEEGLVFEANTTAAQRQLGLVSYHDIVPDSFRGANLYTNPQSGSGILQANTQPPLAQDLALFMTSMFYANTSTKYQQSLNLLGVERLISGTSSISIVQDGIVNTYTFVSPIAQVVQTVFPAGSVFISNGVSDYFDIFSSGNATKYRVWFQSGTSTAPTDLDTTLVQVTLTGTETPTQVATAVAAAMAPYSADFTIVQSSNELTFTNTGTGVTNLAVQNVFDPGFAIATLQEGLGESASKKFVLLSSAATPSQQIDETSRSLVRVINLNSNDIVYAEYLSSNTSVPGQMNLTGRTIGVSAFYVLASDAQTGNSFSPAIAPTNTISSISAANPTVITSANHGLTNGTKIIVVASDSTPAIDGIQTVSNVTTNTFTVPVNVTVPGTTAAFIRLSAAQTATNNVAPNRIYYSRVQQPEAVPILNFFEVGARDEAVVRILALRDALVVLKQDSIWLVTGTDAISGFTATLFDSSTKIAAADSAVVLNNQVFAFTNQGVSTITSTGVSVVSRPIENLLLPLLIQPNFPTATFGVAYESDRGFMLWTTTNPEDTQATQCFRYNTFGNSWTTWDITKTCGIVQNEFLYLGAGDTNYIEIERKNFDRTDYSDREFSKTLNTGSVSGTLVSIGQAANVSVNDVLYQQQYLTIYKLNQMLNKLDTDMNASFHNYTANFAGAVGQDLRQNLTGLAAELDTDTGINNSTFSSSISGFTNSFPDTQSAYNTIVTILNASGAAYKNYPMSTGTYDFESRIDQVDYIKNTVTTDVPMLLVAGAALVFEHIPVLIQFNPQFFGDSELLKQVSEAKFLFDRTNFTRATISYSTDLSPAFEEYEFFEQGNGSFGNQVFGDTNFGGNGDKTPLRTLVPRNKQRCRFLIPQIEHAVAREKMSVIGYSMFFTSHSPRAYSN